MTEAIILLPLPKETDFGFRDESGLWNVQDGFTHDQMQAYATAAVEADRAQQPPDESWRSAIDYARIVNAAIKEIRAELARSERPPHTEAEAQEIMTAWSFGAKAHTEAVRRILGVGAP